MNKYIHITEKKLNDIIQQKINESIQKIIAEYADTRKNVIEKINGYFPQIAINWCLVHYCTLLNENINNCKNHWKTELRDNILNCSTHTIKGNNSVDARRKVISASENIRECLSNYKIIFNIVGNKFLKENINIKNNEQFEITIQHLIENKDAIINLIANNDIYQIIDYIEEI